MSFYSKVVYPDTSLGVGPYTFSKPYLNKKHVKAYVDEVEVPFTWVTDSTVQLVSEALDPSTVVIARETPKEEGYVDFNNGSILMEQNLDQAILQVLFVTQEGLDALEGTLNANLTGEFDALSNKIINLAPATETGDAVAYEQVVGILDDIQALADQVAQDAAEAEASAQTAAQYDFQNHDHEITDVTGLQDALDDKLEEVPDDSITAAKIPDGEISSDKLTDNSITPVKFAENILPDGTDLNTVIDSGSYRLAQNHSNWPDSLANYGQMIVSRNSDTIFQMISYYHNNEVYVRTGYGINYAPTFLPWKKLGGSDNVLHVQDQKAYNIEGGTSVAGTDQQRELNTVVKNGISGASLLNNQIYLPAGKYEIKASCPAYYAHHHSCRLYNVTDSSAVLTGVQNYTHTDADGRCFVEGEFTLTSGAWLEIQHRVWASRSSNGLGIRSNLTDYPSVYTDVQIWEMN